MEECSEEESDQRIAHGPYINKQGTMLTLCGVTQLYQLVSPAMSVHVAVLWCYQYF